MCTSLYDSVPQTGQSEDPGDIDGKIEPKGVSEPYEQTKIVLEALGMCSVRPWGNGPKQNLGKAL